MQLKIQSDPYGLKNLQEQNKKEQEKSEEMLKLLEGIVIELRKIGESLENIETRLNK